MLTQGLESGAGQSSYSKVCSPFSLSSYQCFQTFVVLCFKLSTIGEAIKYSLEKFPKTIAVKYAVATKNLLFSFYL